MNTTSPAIRTVIRGGYLVTADGELRADVVVDDRQIVAVLADASGIDADIRIDARRLLLLPGMVETWFPAPWLHDIDASERAHLQQTAALAGGLTSMAAEPGDAPTSVGTPSHLSMDAAIWLPITAETIPTTQQLERMKQIGLIGVSASLRGEHGLRDAELYSLMQALAEHDLPLAIRPLHGGIRAGDIVSESLVTSTLMIMAQATGAWVHLHSVTSADAVRIAVDAKQRGVHVTLGVPVLHLTTPIESGRRLRVAPPFRPQENLDALWHYVKADQIDCVSIASVRPGEIDTPTTDAQTALSLFWHQAVYKRGLDRAQVTRMLSTNPAKILGIHPQKGSLAVGSDADIVLFDPVATWKAANGDMLDGTNMCTIHGSKITGQVVRTLVGGRTVYDIAHHTDDSLVIPATGRLLHRR